MDDVDGCRCAFEAGRASTPKVSSSQALKRFFASINQGDEQSRRQSDVLLARQRKASQELPSVEELQLAWTWCKKHDRSELEVVAVLEGVAGLLVS